MAASKLEGFLKNLRVTWKGQKINKINKTIKNQLQCVQVDHEGREDSFMVEPTDDAYLKIMPGDQIDICTTIGAFRDGLYMKMISYQSASASKEPKGVRV